MPHGVDGSESKCRDPFGRGIFVINLRWVAQTTIKAPLPWEWKAPAVVTITVVITTVLLEPLLIALQESLTIGLLVLTVVAIGRIVAVAVSIEVRSLRIVALSTLSVIGAGI